MTQTAFSRSAPVYRSGVQLLYLADASERGTASDSDQVVAIPLRADRGAIDRAFPVTASNRSRSLGQATSILASALNEAHVHVYEALANGAAQVVCSRIVPAAATLSYMVATMDATSKAVTWSVASALPADYLVAIRHLECFNDGVKIGIHAVEAADNTGAAVASKVVKVRLYDVVSGELLFDDFTGSLVVTDKDQSGNSYFLGSTVASQTDLVEVSVKGTSVPATSNIYGQDANGNDQWVYATLSYFNEGGTTYAATDYDAALNRLFHANQSFGYLGAGGSKNVALLSKLDALATKMNKVFVFDVPGELSLTGAVAFMANVGLDNHYTQALWAPLNSDDPLNGGKAIIGTSGAHLGMRCKRNAQTDANGVAPKHYPVAGSMFPLTGRTGVRQLVNLEDTDLEKLAKAKINPVISQTYASGAKYVFLDSLTCSKSNGDKQLAAVAEMSAAVDEAIAIFTKEALQKPISEAIRLTTRYIESLFPALQTAGWLVPSDDMGGAAYMATIKPNSAQPKQKIDERHSCSYEGTTRVITVGQTLSR